MTTSFGYAIQDALLTLELHREFAFLLVVVFLTTMLHLFASSVHSDIFTVSKGLFFLASIIASVEVNIDVISEFAVLTNLFHHSFVNSLS